MARSPKALIYVYLKFATDVPHEKIQIFEKALREFVKSRPREWANITGFRAQQVAADLGYIGTMLRSQFFIEHIKICIQSISKLFSCLVIS
jgi:hypothetical protein